MRATLSIAMLALAMLWLPAIALTLALTVI